MSKFGRKAEVGETNAIQGCASWIQVANQLNLNEKQSRITLYHAMP